MDFLQISLDFIWFRMMSYDVLWLLKIHMISYEFAWYVAWFHMIFDFIWYHRIGLCRVSCDLARFHMISYELLGVHKLPYDFVWFHVIVYDFCRLHMISHDFTWFHMIRFWFYMGPYVLLWFRMISTVCFDLFSGVDRISIVFKWFLWLCCDFIRFTMSSNGFIWLFKIAADCTWFILMF